eukprot:976960-Prorocentrum_minimum.AAC.1
MNRCKHTSLLRNGARYARLARPIEIARDGTSRCRMRGYILTTEQSDAGCAGIFSRRAKQMQDARVYSRDGPIICRMRGYILTTDQSDAGCAGIF